MCWGLGLGLHVTPADPSHTDRLILAPLPHLNLLNIKIAVYNRLTWILNYTSFNLIMFDDLQ
jgi:hypothetical protein